MAEAGARSCRRSRWCGWSARAPKRRWRPCAWRVGSRAARAVVKFEGCYHGHGDSFLVKAGSGAATFGTPDSPGVTAATARDTLTARFNDLGAVARAVRRAPRRGRRRHRRARRRQHGRGPAGAGVPEDLRELSRRDGALLIFDEVMTGFRVARGGAQERYGVTPDLTTLARSSAAACPSARTAAGGT